MKQIKIKIKAKKLVRTVEIASLLVTKVTKIRESNSNLIILGWRKILIYKTTGIKIIKR